MRIFFLKKKYYMIRGFFEKKNIFVGGFYIYFGGFFEKKILYNVRIF